jgi:hypothetical protein
LVVVLLIFLVGLVALAVLVKPDLGGFVLGGSVLVVLSAAADRLLVRRKPPPVASDIGRR